MFHRGDEFTVRTYIVKTVFPFSLITEVVVVLLRLMKFGDATSRPCLHRSFFSSVAPQHLQHVVWPRCAYLRERLPEC